MGSVYVAGQFRQSLDFGTASLTSANDNSTFLAKYSAQGDVAWVRSVVGLGYSEIRAMAVDPSGSLYTGGYFSGTVSFVGSAPLTNQGIVEILASKISKQGDLQWVRTGGSTTSRTIAEIRSISVSDQGKVYLAGRLEGQKDLGCGPLVSLDDVNTMLFTYGSDGTALSSQQWGGQGADDDALVVSYGSYNCYVIGRNASQFPLGSLNLSGSGRYIVKMVPIGAPAVFLNGARYFSGKAYARGLGAVSITTPFIGGTILYTLDGSDPAVSGRFYTGPFQVKQSSLLRAVAYNADFTQFTHADPVEVVIVPTMTVSTAGGGSIAVDPPSGAYSSNGTATLTATPLPGWTFLQWLGDATGTNPVASVEMSKKRCVEAVFGTSLSTAIVGAGTVALSPSPPLYPYGSTVRLTGLPASGGYLALWGNSGSGTNNPLTFSVTNASPTVTAVFASLAGGSLRSLAVQPAGSGSVQRTPYANTYTNGARVTLTAVPEPGQQFLGWTGAASGMINPLVVTLDSSKVLGAVFTDGPRLVLPPCVEDVSPFRGWLVGGVGSSFLVQSTTNLPATATNWLPLATVTNSFGTVQFEDSTATNSQRRFYRALSNQ